MKIKLKILYLLFTLICFLPLSCAYGTNNFFYKENDVNKRVEEIKVLRSETSDVSALPNIYNILVLADTHFGSHAKKTKTEPFLTWLDALNEAHKELMPKFCLILGDNVDHGFEKEYVVFQNFVKEIEKRGVEVVSVVGNHDLYNSGWKHYKKYCYPYCGLFKFETKRISWYAIDTGTGTIGQKQYEILSKALKNDPNPKIIMTHYPLANTRREGALSLHDSTERNLLIDLFGRNNVIGVLSGHLHYADTSDLSNFKEFGNPSFCYRDKGWTMYKVVEPEKGFQPYIVELPRNY